MGHEAQQDETVGVETSTATKRKRPGMALVLVCALMLAGAGGGIYGGRYIQAQSKTWLDGLEPAAPPGSEEVIFTLERGWSLSRTAQEMADRGIIRDAESFIRLGRQENQAESLKAGRFLLSPSMSAYEILEELVKGSVLTTRFTIPEGYTLKQIAKVFAEKGIADEEAFWQCVSEDVFAYAFLADLPEGVYRLEGYLFPDTYIIELDEPVESVIHRMLRRFEEIWESLPARETGLDDRDTLILASMVQNEVKLDEERPVVAGVFMQRLRIGMLLQSCSTVQYYFDEPKYPLLTADTQIDFPYNTYLYPGLPPGPVSSPGRASLEAAALPDATAYLYFVARDDGSGGHYFSQPLAEHNRAVAQARANRAAQ